jgi:hypothetical protein
LAGSDGASRDRQYSTRSDFVQYVEEMGKFLSAADPDLRRSLDWPGQGVDPEADLFAEGGLKDRIQAALLANAGRLKEYRDREQELLQPLNASEDTLAQLEDIQRQILNLGDVPDYPGVSRAAAGFSTRLVMSDQVTAVERVAQWALRLPNVQADQWNLVSRLARIAAQTEGDLHRCFLDALQAAICADGETVLWQLLTALQDAPEPPWWFEVVGQLRRLAPGLEADSLPPLTAARQLSLSLQAQVQHLEHPQTASGQNRDLRAGLEAEDHPRLASVAGGLKEDILASWTQVDPDPPHAFLDYADLDRLLAELDGDFSAEVLTLARLLVPAKAQVQTILDAWERQDFTRASLHLRRLALYDPDRRRVLRADQMLTKAPAWLKKIHMGPHPGENFQEFITSLEFEGRELRNHVGPAGWLDALLESLSKLRKGAWPADLLPGAPHLGREMPWLKRFERTERLPLEAVSRSILEATPAVVTPVTPVIPGSLSTDSRPAGGSQAEAAQQPQPLAVNLAVPGRISGLIEGAFGPGGSLAALGPLDAWAPEARGSSARVYLAELPGESGRPQVALKLMRMDKPDYALPLFREEVQVLALMDPVAGISRMLECGFIHLPDKGALPLDSDLAAICALKGDLLRIGLDSWPEFVRQLDERVDAGWVPYLTLEKREKEDSLLVLCDASHTHGNFQPMITLLQMAIQICDILQAAHERNIVYRDHKILHYYWQNETNGIYMIDWNVARLHPKGLSDDEKQMDLVQFGARGLHHILTGRAAPGALPLGPTRPEEIEQAATSYTAQWTYDDQRLSHSLREIITTVLAGGYTSALVLRDDLKKTCMTLPYSDC